jgi:D-hexose-6-phosphate mutarotase
MTIESLQAKFGIPDVVTFSAGNGGLPKVSVKSALAEGEVYLNGAHVTHWKPAGQNQPVLWMSKESYFQPSKPIRGGVPVIFPWFGPREGHPQSPAHGFARTMRWDIAEVHADADGSVNLAFTLSSNDATTAVWAHDFAMRFVVTIGSSLRMRLEVTNTGPSQMKFEEALHTYFTVGDVKQVGVSGMAGVTYIDKVDGFKKKPQGPEPITITGETDRIYLNTRAACVLNDPVLKRSIDVHKSDSTTTVVWNPWIAKAKAMADFGDDEWSQMICIETCNVADHAVTLAAGATHAMTAEIKVV